MSGISKGDKLMIAIAIVSVLVTSLAFLTDVIKIRNHDTRASSQNDGGINQTVDNSADGHLFRRTESQVLDNDENGAARVLRNEDDAPDPQYNTIIEQRTEGDGSPALNDIQGDININIRE
jgi:hypothetical protein